jgi:hypothetical protein
MVYDDSNQGIRVAASGVFRDIRKVVVKLMGWKEVELDVCSQAGCIRVTKSRSS